MEQIFDFSTEKNTWLIQTRGVSFEEVISILSGGEELDVILHPNNKKYPHQKMYVIELNNYAYLVPFVKNKGKIFLKTIFPNREATKKYLLEK